MNHLDDIRKEIDKTDTELLELFCRRMDLVKGVAAYKIENNMEVFRPERENAILDRVEKSAGKEYGKYARDLFTQMMRISREMQQKMIDESR